MTWYGTPSPSPSGQHMAVVGPPQEVWGNYLAEIALWALASLPRLRYYRAGQVAHALDTHPTDQPTFLYWSQAGDWLTFYEFKRPQTYQVVFIQVATDRVYRVPAADELLLQLSVLSQSGPQLECFLQRVEHQVGALVMDDATAGLHPR